MRLVDADTASSNKEKSILNKLPTIEAEPERHAHWVRSCIGTHSFCTFCHCRQEYETAYCPDCGAIMYEEEE